MGFFVFIYIYKHNGMGGGSGGGVVLSGYQDRHPNRCSNKVNVLGSFYIGIYDESVSYSYLYPELGGSIYHL